MSGWMKFENKTNGFLVYRTPYAKNPFDSVSDQEIEEYKRQVEISQKGIPGKIWFNLNENEIYFQSNFRVDLASCQQNQNLIENLTQIKTSKRCFNNDFALMLLSLWSYSWLVLPSFIE